MEALQCILTRRSIRRYTSAPITAAQMDVLLRAAMQAPSAVNRQPWHFVVVDDRDTLLRCTHILPNGQMLAEAPAAILVCGDMEMAHPPSPGYLLQDCSAAIQNILLAAHASGLGAVWLGVYPREERVRQVRAQFELPEHVIPVGMIALGHPGEQPQPEDRFNLERIHRNRWHRQMSDQEKSR